MKKTFLTMALTWPMWLCAQEVQVKGYVKDTSANLVLSNVVISFLNEADSTLIGFTRTDGSGRFSKNIRPGNYLLLVTSPVYADFVIPLHVLQNKPVDLKEVPLTSRARLLEEIIVSQQPIRMRGDTTEYMADSFRVKPNASVEDLLRILPGIQVNRDGSIVAQGRKVQKILVDGDEFFSDDPTIATRNLRADAVRKVQVFDQKSDQAGFTGIDDGQRTKTINLELKDSAKDGYFGKLSAAGLDQYYNLQAMINMFKNKRKLAAFAIGSTTSETGLDLQNGENYGFKSASTQLSAETGGIMVSAGESSETGSSSFKGMGLPESIKAGLHYSNRWVDDKTKLSSNYLFNDLKIKNNTRELAQNIIEDAVYYSEIKSEYRTDEIKNDLSGSLNITIDSTSSVKVDIKGGIGKNSFRNFAKTVNLTEQNELINNGNRKTRMESTNENGSINALYMKKFRNTGQSMSVNLSQGHNNYDQDGFLYNESSFFYHGSPTSPPVIYDTIDQKKISAQSRNTFSAGATFTQPLSRSDFLVFDYSFTRNGSSKKQLTYDRGVDSKYEEMDTDLSNKYDFVYNINSTGINYLRAKGKLNFSAGSGISFTTFKQHDLYADTARSSIYLNLSPQISFTYNFSSFRSLRINYDGYTIQPSIDQIQPLKDNADPLNIQVGNPGLKQAFSNSFNIFFTDIKKLNERYLVAGGNFTLVNNEINQSYYLDNLGRKVSQYMNTDGNFVAQLFLLTNRKIPGSDWRFGVGPLVQIFRYSNFVNLQKSITNTSNYRIRMTVQGGKPDKFEINFSADPGYNVLRSNISKASAQNYWAANLNLNGNYRLPLKMEIGTDVSVGLRQKITSFDRNNNIILWNAYLEKKLLKNESLALRASVFDILDKNRGYDRFKLSTGLYEQHYLTWGQYGLISLTYNFVKKGSKGPDDMKGAIHF